MEKNIKITSIKLLSTKSHKQGEMRCGPASLKIVAEYFGIAETENRLAKLCKTNIKIGTTGKNIIKAAIDIGLTGRIHDNANYEQIELYLKKKIPVIVNWFSPGQSRPANQSRMASGHYSVVIGISPTHIVLEDPGLGDKRALKRSEFLKVWFDYEKQYPKKPKDIILRRMIVVRQKLN